MPLTKKFPCNTTRCFDESIHPKILKPNVDIASFRLQIRKNSSASWTDVCNTLSYRSTSDWLELFYTPENSSIKSNTLVSTWRMRHGRMIAGMQIIRPPGKQKEYYRIGADGKYRRIKDQRLIKALFKKGNL